MAENKFEFKAEMKQLLNLIIHSLYTNSDVFLRELVSNSSDALNRVRFKKLSEEIIFTPQEELAIKITLDKDNATFTLEDTGDGMTREELIDRLGTIANSGTLKFLEELKKSGKTPDSRMIGQFGVGFYSVFMVTDEVSVESRSSDPAGKPWIWKSDGESSFTIDEGSRLIRGTKISFKLKDEFKRYSEEYEIKQILQKYSNFVDFPIYLNGAKVNTVTALWQRKKEDVKKEELDEFYKFITNDWQEPMGSLHLNIEGNLNFKALLFIPQTAPNTLFRDVMDKSVQLYSSRVFIQDDCKELLPDYLKFVRGVVDTEDLPLNVSREVIQKSAVTLKIKNVLTSKILGMLDEWKKEDPEKYRKFFKNFGSLFKTGLTSDFSNKDKITDLLLFDSSKTKIDEPTTLADYISRMKPEQTEIYYILGDSRSNIEKDPKLEYFRKKDFEVIFLTDTVDYFTIPYLVEYDKKKLVSVDKAEIKTDEKIEESVEQKELQNTIIAKFKQALGDKVEDVVESKHLVESPAALVSGKNGADPQMEKMMQMFDKNFQKSKQVLEINTEHELIKNIYSMIQSGVSDETVNVYINQLFEGALLQEGDLRNPGDYLARMTQIMIAATKNK